MRHDKKAHMSKKKPVKVMEKSPLKPTEFAEWMDQDDVGEDLRGWTPTGWIEPKAETLFEMTGEDRPEWTQGEERFIEQEMEHLPPNDD